MIGAIVSTGTFVFQAVLPVTLWIGAIIVLLRWESCDFLDGHVEVSEGE